MDKYRVYRALSGHLRTIADDVDDVDCRALAALFDDYARMEVWKRRWWTVAQAAFVLGLNRQTVHDAALHGRIPSRMGRYGLEVPANAEVIGWKPRHVYEPHGRPPSGRNTHTGDKG